MRFSLIIPARNEVAYLPRLLETVEAARRLYHGGPDAIEVVVADNASTDRTAALALERGCRVVRVEKRLIAAVRNGGAAAARGEVLAFVDADTQIHPETFNAIDRALATGRVIAGATGVTLERISLGIAVTLTLFIPTLWITGFDTGVVFCRREDFDAVGGYNENLRIAEDVRFLWDLKRRGWRCGRKLARIRSVKGVASTRKFDKYGEWHYLIDIPRALITGLFSRRRLDDFIRGYWYGDDR